MLVDWTLELDFVEKPIIPTKDQIHSFLLSGLFPRHAYVTIEVVLRLCRSAYLPYTSKVADFTSHFFYVPGVEFTLALGKRATDYIEAVSVVSNPERPILVGSSPA
jgi:hypothetical protein